MNTIKRYCNNCGKMFCSDKDKRYCSDKCAISMYNKFNKEKNLVFNCPFCDSKIQKNTLYKLKEVSKKHILENHIIELKRGLNE